MKQRQTRKSYPVYGTLPGPLKVRFSYVLFCDIYVYTQIKIFEKKMIKLLDILKEVLTSIPVEKVVRPNGSIGTQGVVTDQIKDILKNVLNLSVPENATMKDMVELFKKDKKNIDSLLDFTKKNPIVILELPDGSIQIKDGHHRAFLLYHAGVKDLPVIKK